MWDEGDGRLPVHEYVLADTGSTDKFSGCILDDFCFIKFSRLLISGFDKGICGSLQLDIRTFLLLANNIF